MSLKTEILADAMGRVLGRYSARRIMTGPERKWASDFLFKLQRKRMDEMSKTNVKEKVSASERINMAFLAGEVKTINVESDRAWLLLECGSKDWIACSVFKQDALLETLSHIRPGDWLQVRALIKPWSKKYDDETKRGVNIEITEIKNHLKGVTPAADNQRRKVATDDDIPF